MFVAYSGSGPAISDLLGGQIDFLWDQVTNGLPQIPSGALHGIAITSPQRLEQLKDVALRAALTDPGVRKRLNQLETLPFPEAELTPEAHARLFAADLPRVAKLVRRRA